MKPAITCHLILVLLVAQGCSARESLPPPLDVQAGDFTSAQRCGDCHQDIYEVWKTSLHASSLTNATFQASLKEIPDAADAQTCMGCHAPVAVHSSEKGNSPISKEGVTCDYCHSIRDVDSIGKAALDVGPVKYGPISNANSNGHQIQYSPLHAESAVCTGCHEFQNAAGLKVLSTFSEWQSSDSAKSGVTCQRCHMPLSTMNVVDPRVKREPASFVNLHEMPGGHSKDQLFKALELRILEMTRHGAEFQVKVLVRNKGAGHNVPTGMPTRQVVLATEVSGSETGEQAQSRVYGSVIQDKTGRTLDHDSHVFLTGVRYASDTRLRPGESRTETFKFKIRPDENLEVRTSLAYRYTPLGLDQSGLNIQFAERRQQSVLQWNEGKAIERKKP